MIDLCFPLSDGSIQYDHGYALYSALCHRERLLHRAPWLGVHPLEGPVREKRILLRGAELRLRVPREHVHECLPLVGQRIRVRSGDLRIGAPHACELSPSPALEARAVLLKLTDPPRREGKLNGNALVPRYLAELRRQLQALEIEAAPVLTWRRTVAIRGRRLAAFGCRVEGLSAEESLRLQAHGLGGRRALGCGIFRPSP